jgi:hypothetical protein
MSRFTPDTHFVVFMNAKDPTPSVDLHSREALAPSLRTLATAASLNNPADLALDNAGNLYVSSDIYGSGTGNVVRKITPNGIITTVAGTGVSGYWGDGGAATSAALSSPRGLAINAAGDGSTTRRKRRSPS